MPNRRRITRTGPAIVYVANSSELTTALSDTAGGKVIICTDGSYSGLTISSKAYAAPVQVRSQTPLGAVFPSISVTNVSNLNLYQLKVVATFSVSYGSAVKFDTCTYCSLAECDVSYAPDPQLVKFGRCFSVINAASSHINIIGNNFYRFSKGYLNAASYLYVVNNTFSEYNEDGIETQSITNSIIELNKFRYGHGYGSGAFAVHADVIAIDYNQSNNIFRDNFAYVDKFSWSQGYANTNGSTQSDMLIDGNIFSASYTIHGVTSTTNNTRLTEKNNCLMNYLVGQQESQYLYRTDFGYTWTDSYHTNNVGMQKPGTISGITQSGSVVMQNSNPAAALYASDLFINPFGGESPADFLPIPGSVVDFGNDVGPWRLTQRYLADQWCYITNTSVATAAVTFTIQAYPGSNCPSLIGATYSWDFDEVGSSAGSGTSPSHTFTAQGRHDVVCTITPATGSPFTCTKTVRVTASGLAGDPVLSSGTASASAGGGTIGATTTIGHGKLYWVVTTSATAPGAFAVIYGFDHQGLPAPPLPSDLSAQTSYARGYGSVSVTSTGAKTVDVTGLVAGTTHYGYMVQVDEYENISNVMSCGSFTPT